MTQQADEWDASYRGDEPPPWDLGRPQPVFADLAERGLLTGRLLDCGCGTGEHSLLAAAHGATATGIDLSRTAVAAARSKARARGLAATFVAGDVLELPLEPESFDTAVDSGLFHSFDDADRARYVAVLTRALRPGGMLYLACFSDREPGDWGPRRVSESELRAAYADGWSIETLAPATFDVVRLAQTSVDAWLLAARRI
jgi:SAM-dependent methyltransferase